MDSIVLLSNRGEPYPQRNKGPEPLGYEVRVLCHSQAKWETARSGPLWLRIFTWSIPPSLHPRASAAFIHFALLDDNEVEVSLIERLNEAALRGGQGRELLEERHLGEAV